MNKKHWTLYVLKLEQGKWYVGITSQPPEVRFQEHLHGRKAYWTEKYPPQEIADSKYLGDLDYEAAKAYENKVTRRLMREKGVNNVRGGDLTQTSDYAVRFGYIWDKFSLEALVVVSIQLLIIAMLLLDRFFS